MKSDSPPTYVHVHWWRAAGHTPLPSFNFFTGALSLEVNMEQIWTPFLYSYAKLVQQQKIVFVLPGWFSLEYFLAGSCNFLDSLTSWLPASLRQEDICIQPEI